MVAMKECKHLAAQLFAETVARHQVEAGLIVHADLGSAMKSDTLAQLLASLGVSRSFSRPQVSDDNAFSEAQFKTLKYQPDYPGRFGSLAHGRTFLQESFGWHNDEHHHAGLALFTPADVFHGRVEAVAARRQITLDEAFRKHPERFPRRPAQGPTPRRRSSHQSAHQRCCDRAAGHLAERRRRLTGSAQRCVEPGGSPGDIEFLEALSQTR
jgi:putative transposase